MHQDNTFDNNLNKTAKIPRDIFNKLDSDEKKSLNCWKKFSLIYISFLLFLPLNKLINKL